MRPSLAPPVSIKLRTAVCHMDFDVKDLSAVETAAYKRKIQRVDKILSKPSGRPRLLCFPECCASDFLISAAARWANRWGIVTICGTRFNPATARIESPIVYPGGRTAAQKYHVSPLDRSNCSAAIVRGAAPGATIDLDAEGVDGKPYRVGIGVLICFDFRFFYQDGRFANWNAVRLLVVPMWDGKFKEPQSYAGVLARRYWTRCLLVNKATPHDSKSLPSTGHGPFNASDFRMISTLGARKKNSQLWKLEKEGLLVGDYEVGINVTQGHESAYGAGFNYENFKWFPFGSR